MRFSMLINNLNSRVTKLTVRTLQLHERNQLPQSLQLLSFLQLCAFRWTHASRALLSSCWWRWYNILAEIHPLLFSSTFGFKGDFGNIHKLGRKRVQHDHIGVCAVNELSNGSVESHNGHFGRHASSRSHSSRGRIRSCRKLQQGRNLVYHHQRSMSIAQALLNASIMTSGDLLGSFLHQYSRYILSKSHQKHSQSRCMDDKQRPKLWFSPRSPHSSCLRTCPCLSLRPQLLHPSLLIHFAISSTPYNRPSFLQSTCDQRIDQIARQRMSGNRTQLNYTCSKAQLELLVQWSACSHCREVSNEVFLSCHVILYESLQDLIT